MMPRQTLSVRESVLDSQRPIIDPHHHLGDWRRFEPPTPRHNWDEARVHTPRYLLDELVTDLDRGHNVRATVHVECGSMYRISGAPEQAPVGETEFINGVAAMGASGTYGDRRPCLGIVGYTDLRLGSQAAAVLEAHILAGGGRFRGIRQSSAYDPDENVVEPSAVRRRNLYLDPSFREGFRCLKALNLSFDAWVLEPQLPDLINLAQTFPDAAICLNHMGMLVGVGRYAGKRDERFDIWRSNLTRLAKCPNVYVKLGGLGMRYAGLPSLRSDPPASSAILASEWRPYIETCIDIFSPSRAMFESNFPVDGMTCDYVTLWNTFKRLAEPLSEAEKHDLFYGSAARFYRLELGRP